MRTVVVGASSGLGRSIAIELTRRGSHVALPARRKDRLETAAVPYLAASAGKVAYLSSVSASLTPPWPGLGAYIVSKAALDKLVEAQA
jgi:NAD(P)-dependent dehydrogenase (short-subunit alcohol dehydrogenase family)